MGHKKTVSREGFLKILSRGGLDRDKGLLPNNMCALNNKWEFIEKPIFILGIGRSGTTLLQTLLDSHEEILNIPAELHYYLDWKMINYLYGDNPHLNDINKYFFTMTDIGYFGDHVPVGAGKPYNTTSISKTVFRDYLNNNSLKNPSPKEYLQLLVWAVVGASHLNFQKNCNRFKYFLCCMNVFHIEEILRDFPHAKIIVMDRDKVEVYLSQRRFWLKNFASYYIPSYRCFPEFHFRKPYVLEMMMEYILDVVNAKTRYKGHKNVLKIDLHKLIERPQDTLRELTEWLGIEFTKALDMQTMCGNLYGGNLTTGNNSHGRVLKVRPGKIQREDLSRIEYLCLKRLIPEEVKPENIESDITEYKCSRLTLLLEFIKLLPYESTIKSKRALLRFPITYVMNRYILFRYLFKKENVSIDDFVAT